MTSDSDILDLVKELHEKLGGDISKTRNVLNNMTLEIQNQVKKEILDLYNSEKIEHLVPVVDPVSTILTPVPIAPTPKRFWCC